MSAAADNKNEREQRVGWALRALGAAGPHGMRRRNAPAPHRGRRRPRGQNRSRTLGTSHVLGRRFYPPYAWTV